MHLILLIDSVFPYLHLSGDVGVLLTASQVAIPAPLGNHTLGLD